MNTNPSPSATDAEPSAEAHIPTRALESGNQRLTNIEQLQEKDVDAQDKDGDFAAAVARIVFAAIGQPQDGLAQAAINRMVRQVLDHPEFQVHLDARMTRQLVVGEGNPGVAGPDQKAKFEGVLQSLSQQGEAAPSSASPMSRDEPSESPAPEDAAPARPMPSRTPSSSMPVTQESPLPAQSAPHGEVGLPPPGRNSRVQDSGDEVGHRTSPQATTGADVDDELPEELRAQLEDLVRSSTPEMLAEYKELARRQLGANADNVIRELDRLSHLAGDATDGGDLPDDFEELVLQAAGQLRRARSAKFALDFCGTKLAPAVRRLEDQDSSPEQLVDLMVNLFASEPVYENSQFGPRTPPASWQFVEVLNRLLALIWPEFPTKQGRFDVNELQTLTNLMTWMGSGRQAKRQERIAWGSQLALKMLDSMLHGTPTPRLHRIIFQVCNNLAGWLGDLARDTEETPDSLELPKQLNALHTLATVADLKMGLVPAWEARALPVMTALGLPAQGAESPRAHGVAKALLFMSRIPTAWRALCPMFDALVESRPAMAGGDPTSLRTAVLTLMSAVFRAEFNTPAEADEVSSALFNLGVDLLRFESSATSVERANPARVLSNALGLWWALDQARRQGLELDAALGNLNGASCAVNLFGAVSDGSRAVAGSALLKPLRGLASELLQAFEVHGLRTQMTRLTGSTRSLFGDADDLSSRRQSPSLARTQKYLEEALPLLVNKEALQGMDPDTARLFELPTWPNALPEKFSVMAAALLGCLLRQLRSADIEDMAQHIQQLSEGWIEVVGRLLELSAPQQGYEVFDQSALIPRDLSNWASNAPAIPGLRDAKVIDSLRPHLLSQTLADAKLMGGFFGTLPAADMRWDRKQRA